MSRIIHGDCVEQMQSLDPDSVDSIVTDPPYLIQFMGKEWDGPGKSFVERKSVSASGGFDAIAGNHHPVNAADVQRTALSQGRKMQRFHESWAVEALRVAKPGAFLLAFGSTRTVHRLTVALEDAGWVIRDQMCWVYASGFPKSLNVGRSIDTRLCKQPGRHCWTEPREREKPWHVCPVTPEGEAHKGAGTALKPAWEPIVVARKTLIGNVAENVLEHGTGSLDIDGCRIGMTKDVPASPRRAAQNAAYGDLSNDRADGEGWNPNSGRWPANLVLTDPVFDGGVVGVVGGGDTGKAGTAVNRNRDGVSDDGVTYGYMPHSPGPDVTYGDSGTYSRFFLIPKASRKDREPEVPGDLEAARPETTLGGTSRECKVCASRSKASGPNARWPDCPHDDWEWVTPLDKPHKGARRNTHPTVKPQALMRHLVRLVTPKGGTVLDPFLGSGTTALAARDEGMEYVGIEQDADYIRIAEQRLVRPGLGL